MLGISNLPAGRIVKGEKSMKAASKLPKVFKKNSHKLDFKYIILCDFDIDFGIRLENYSVLLALMLSTIFLASGNLRFEKKEKAKKEAKKLFE